MIIAISTEIIISFPAVCGGCFFTLKKNCVEGEIGIVALQFFFFIHLINTIMGTDSLLKEIIKWTKRFKWSLIQKKNIIKMSSHCSKSFPFFQDVHVFHVFFWKLLKNDEFKFEIDLINRVTQNICSFSTNWKINALKIHLALDSKNGEQKGQSNP